MRQFVYMIFCDYVVIGNNMYVLKPYKDLLTKGNFERSINKLDIYLCMAMLSIIGLHSLC